jgi:hypothetical protein
MAAGTLDMVEWENVPNALRNLHLERDNTMTMIAETKDELDQILNAIA